MKRAVQRCGRQFLCEIIYGFFFFYSGNYAIKESSVPKVNNVKNTIKILKEKKGEEFNEICNQDMSNRSTQSSELRVNQLPNESNQDLVQSAMDTNIIILPEKAHNQHKNKNKKIGEKELIKALKNFLTGKKLSNILNIKIANKSQETNILSEKALLDYIDKLITKNYPLIKQGVKDTILKRLYYCIEICKKKEKKKHKVNEINDELKQPSDSEIDKQDDNDYDEKNIKKNIKKKDKKSNLVDVIINWIETNFKVDFKEISKMELKKKEKNKSEGKLNIHLIKNYLVFCIKIVFHNFYFYCFILNYFNFNSTNRRSSRR